MNKNEFVRGYRAKVTIVDDWTLNISDKEIEEVLKPFMRNKGDINNGEQIDINGKRFTHD